MNNNVGLYNHLDNIDKINFDYSIPEIVDLIMEMNYGVHRFLSSLVEKSKEKQMWDKRRILIENIEKLLNDGCF